MPRSPTQRPPISRRTFLKTGFIGALLLASAGGVYRAVKTNAATERAQLGAEAHSIFAAVIPVMLKGAIEKEHVPVAIERVRQAIAGLPLSTQKEIQDLFVLLSLSPVRRFVAGVTNDWSDASSEEIADFLHKWRLSRYALLQSAYHALHDLITGSWYADESTWAEIGYPGPLKEFG